MKLLTNENFPLTSVTYLRNNGYDVIHVGSDFGGISDISFLEIEILQKRTIITFDKDYGELIFKHGLKPPEGIIFLRIIDFDPEYPGKLVHRLLSTPKLHFSKKLTVVDKNSIRQRIYE
jgi:predicted nuclease of predicted toxin-antitoxin system